MGVVNASKSFVRGVNETISYLEAESLETDLKWSASIWTGHLQIVSGCVVARLRLLQR